MRHVAVDGFGAITLQDRGLDRAGDRRKGELIQGVHLYLRGGVGLELQGILAGQAQHIRGEIGREQHTRKQRADRDQSRFGAFGVIRGEQQGFLKDEDQLMTFVQIGKVGAVALQKPHRDGKQAGDQDQAEKDQHHFLGDDDAQQLECDRFLAFQCVSLQMAARCWEGEAKLFAAIFVNQHA